MKTQISPSIQPSRGGEHKNLGSKLISPSPRQVLVEVAKLYVQYSITSMVQLVTFGILWVFQCSCAFQLVPYFKSLNSLISKASKEASPSHLYAALSEVLETSSAAIKPIMPFSNVVAIIPRDAVSSFKVKPLQTAVSWREVLEQVQVKLGWEELNVTLSIVEEEELLRQKGPLTGDVAILVGIKGEEADLGGARLKRLEESVRGFKAIAPFDCSASISNELLRYGEYNPSSPFEPLSVLVDDNIYKRSPRRKQRLAYQIANECWNRRSSDDILFALLVLIDTFSVPVASVQSQTSTETTSFKQLSCMCSNCGDEMIKCFSNPKCRAALDCLNKCRSYIVHMSIIIPTTAGSSCFSCHSAVEEMTRFAPIAASLRTKHRNSRTLRAVFSSVTIAWAARPLFRPHQTRCR